MNRNNIEQLFNAGRFAATLEALEQSPSSVWKETTGLRCLRALGRNPSAFAMAEQLYGDGISVNDDRLLNAEFSDQLRYIALVFSEQGRAKQAVKIMREICKLAPNNAPLRREFAFALTSAHRIDEAEAQLLKAIKLRPDNASSFSQLARIYCRTGRVSAGIDCYYRAATLEPNAVSHLQRLVYWDNYLETTTQQSNHQLAKLWASKAYPENPSGSNQWPAANAHKRLKIAFISADFHAHAVSFFISPLLSKLDRNSFKVFAYSDTSKHDAVTIQIQANCDMWRDSSKLSDRKLAKQISADQIDILVDLGGHTAKNRMGVFAMHRAPVQLSWLGYPGTTGLKSIGFRITDEIADPIGKSDAHFSEALVKLSNGFLCYQPLESAPPIEERINADKIVFGSFNNLAKISPLTINCWASAMQRVPNSVLYLKRQQLAFASARDHIIRQFSDRGISEDRLILETSNATIEQHLEQYNEIDIALDTSPYNGTTTTLEALWMGVPVVTLTGHTHASRVSASILSRVNMQRFAADSIAEFCTQIEYLANNPEVRQGYRASLRNTMTDSALLDHQQFADEFGAAIKDQWNQWCSAHKENTGLDVSFMGAK